MLKEAQQIKMHSYPGMVAIIGTRVEEKANFMAAGWHSYLSINPPMYGVAIGKERFTYNCVNNTQQFSVNFLPAEYAEFIQLAGTMSGNEGIKTDIAKMKYKWGNKLEVPILEDAYFAYECQVEQMVPTGDHDWVVGKINACHYIPDFFQNNGLPDFAKLNIPLYLGRSTYVTLNSEAKQQAYIDPFSYSEKS